MDRSSGESDLIYKSFLRTTKKVRVKNMRQDTGGNWYPTKEVSSAMTKLMQTIIAREGDDENDDPDSYWHP